MQNKHSCFCFGRKKIREKDIENIRTIIKQAMNKDKSGLKHVENIIGFEDIPVYIQISNIIKYDGRSIRIFYYE